MNDAATERQRGAPIAAGRTAAALQALCLRCGAIFDSLVQSGQALAVCQHNLPDDPIVFVNAAFEELTGYSAADSIGRNCCFLQTPETDPAALAAVRNAIAAGRSVRVDMLNARKNGDVFLNRMHLTPLAGEDGTADFFIVTLADVTPATASDAADSPAGSKTPSNAVKDRIRRARAVSGAAGVWEWDVPGDRLYADIRFAELYGLDPGAAADGLPTEAFFASIHPDDRMRVRIAVGGIMEGVDVFTRDYRIVRSDGTVRWVAARGHAERTADDVPIRFVGVLADITDQKRIEEQLRVAQTAGGVGTFEYVGGFGTVSVSAQFCRLLGLHTAEALPVRTVNALIHPGDPPLIDDPDDGAAGTLLYSEFRATRPDTGETRWLARCGERRQDGHGGRGFIGVIYDITASKAAGEKLRQFAETLEQRVQERTRERDRVWNNSRDLLAVLGGDGIVRSVNPSWQGILGYAADEVAGAPFLDFVHADDAAATKTMLETVGRRGSVRDHETRNIHKDGSSRSISWQMINEDDLVYAYGRDITEEKARAQMLRLTEEQLRQAQKMEAVGQLTGGLAHDFNNILTGIIGSLDMMRRRLDDGRIADLERFMNSATASAERAAWLTHRLLAFSRRQSLDPQTVDVNALIASTEDFLRQTVGEQVTLTIAPDMDVWPAMTDANQLQNALLNLAINARDAMPTGGTLTISTGRTTLDQAYAANQEALRAGDYVRISVSDNGVGMAPGVVAKAFDPFFTTKPIGQGTGLGLSMIYGFIQQTGGHVRIDSVEGRGTTVELFLPRGGGRMPGSDVDEASFREAALGAGETVLVVEDDESIRMLIVEVLAELGYRALEAANDKAALLHIQSPWPINLMITDVGLPGLNGRQLAEIARNHRPDLRVLFVTGYAANAAVRGDFLEPGMDMVLKPFALADLAAKIRAIIEA